MKKIIFLVLLFLGILGYFLGAQQKKNTIEEVNKKITNIEESIKKPGISSLLLKVNHGEWGPYIFEFYYESNLPNNLVLAKIWIAHETWRNEFYYYFDMDGKILKFIKNTVGRPDNPPKSAIIFDKKGEKIWSNFNEKIPMELDEIKQYFSLFKKNLEYLVEKHGEY